MYKSYPQWGQIKTVGDRGGGRFVVGNPAPRRGATWLAPREAKLKRGVVVGSE